MIKHRFILRDVSDFKVFAAIPVEARLLRWRRWQRPPDWRVLEELFLASVHALTGHADQWRSIAAAYLSLADIKLEFTKVGSLDHTEAEQLEAVAERTRDHRRKQAASALDAAEATQGALEDARRVLGLLKSMPDAPQSVWDEAYAQDAPGERPSDDFLRGLAGHIEIMRPFQTLGDVQFETLKTQTHEEMGYYTSIAKNVPAGGRRRDFLVAARAIADKFHETYDILLAMVDTRLAIARTHLTAAKVRAVQHDPLPTTPCPPGLPFAAYTVEFDGTVVNVVEGHAWVSTRALPPVSAAERAQHEQQALREIRKLQAEADATGESKEGQIMSELSAQRKALAENPAPATDEEKRVVEIVSQMLTERSLNPKADTRIPVREVDPKHAHQTREVEKRPGAPTVRTIKFEVTPPRYLREAAEYILSSPRKAHWVIGHWRNQAYGEKRAMRRQSWIKPHIRGLGEASGTTSRVVAPHAGPTT